MTTPRVLPAPALLLAALALAAPAARGDEAAGTETPSAPSFLETPLLGNALWQWLAAVGAALVTVVLLRLLVGWAAGRLGRMSTEVREGIWDLPLELVAGTRALFYLVLGVYAGSLFLTLPAGVRRVLLAVLTVVVLVQAGIWGAHAVRELLLHAVRRRTKEKGETIVTGAVRAFANVVVWTLVAILILENLGVRVTALLAGVSIASVAVALAVQHILGDLFASVAIALDKPFQVGDYLVVGDLLGTVERIGLKTSRLRSLTGEQIVISNSDLLSSRIRNFKRMQDRRITFTFGVVYGTPARQLEAIPRWVREVVEAEEETRFDRTHFARLGDSALEFEAVYYVTEPDYATFCDIQQRINLALYRRFEDEGVEFAFPTRTVHVLRNDAGEAARPAARAREAKKKGGRPRAAKKKTARRRKP